MTFSDWLIEANKTYDRSNGQRYGQWLWNSLVADEHDHIVDAIVGTDLDPFYRDDVVPAFLSEVARLWT